MVQVQGQLSWSGQGRSGLGQAWAPSPPDPFPPAQAIPAQPGHTVGSGGNAPKESALVHMNTILAEQGNNGYDCYCLML